MIRTPEATPGKDKLVKPEDKANEVNYSENNFSTAMDLLSRNVHDNS